MISYFSEFISAVGPAFRHAILWAVFTFLIIPSIWRYFPRIDKWYRQQDYEKRLDFNARATATFHAAFIFLVSFYVMVFDADFTYRDIRSYSALARWSLEFSTGYFLSDCIVLYQLRKYYASQTIAFACHHLVSIFGITQTIKGGAALWFTVLRLCTELSTPFININFMMTLFKMEDSVPFNINRHCGFWTFIICRPCLMPIFWYCTIGHIVSGEFWNIEVGTQAIWIIAGLGLDVLNLIWLKALVIEYYNWIREPHSQCKNRTLQSTQKRQMG